MVAACGKEEYNDSSFPLFLKGSARVIHRNRKGANRMRKAILIVACFLIFQTASPVLILHAGESPSQKGDLPRVLLPKVESNVTVRGGTGSVSFWSNRATLEEILEKIAVEKRVTLRFYCQDPALKQERADRRIPADSLENVLRQLLSEGHRFVSFNQEGKPTESGKNVAVLHIYSKECAETDPPVRIFIAEKEHPMLRKPAEQISLEELRDFLKTGGPASRRRVADLLGKKADEKGIAGAKEALKDENPRVMLAAADALKRLGLKYGMDKVADAIYGRFREKPYAEFLPILAAVDKDRIWPVIDALMDQSGDRERGPILSALLLTNDRRAISYLLRISSANIEISKQAIHGVARIGGPEAAVALMRLLREGDASRKAWAAQAIRLLPKADGVEARAEIEKMVREERAPDELLEALAEVSYFEPIERVIKDPASKAELKIRILKALARRGSDNTIEIISRGLDDKSPQVRLASVEGMGAMATEAAIPHLVRATRDQDGKVRSAAAKGLSELPGYEGVAEALGKLIDDPEEKVRRDAIDALAVLGEPNEAMKTILARCKNHKDPYIVGKANSIWDHWRLPK
jgi:HEAT repeat protein